MVVGGNSGVHCVGVPSRTISLPYLPVRPWEPKKISLPYSSVSFFMSVLQVDVFWVEFPRSSSH